MNNKKILLRSSVLQILLILVFLVSPPVFTATETQINTTEPRTVSSKTDEMSLDVPFNDTTSDTFSEFDFIQMSDFNSFVKKGEAPQSHIISETYIRLQVQYSSRLENSYFAQMSIKSEEIPLSGQIVDYTQEDIAELDLPSLTVSFIIILFLGILVLRQILALLRHYR